MSGILLQIGGADVSVYRETSRDTDSRHLDLDSVQGVHIMVITWTLCRVSTSWCPPGQCTGCPHQGVHLDSAQGVHITVSTWTV